MLTLAFVTDDFTRRRKGVFISSSGGLNQYFLCVAIFLPGIIKLNIKLLKIWHFTRLNSSAFMAGERGGWSCHVTDHISFDTRHLAVTAAVTILSIFPYSAPDERYLCVLRNWPRMR